MLQPHNYYLVRRDITIGTTCYFPKGAEVYYLGTDEKTRELRFIRPHHGTIEIRVPCALKEEYKRSFIWLGGEDYENEK